ncbi:MAG: hypothetical protein R3C32_02835 [Chloroflexota bacterium]
MSVTAPAQPQPSGWSIRDGRSLRLRPLSGNAARLWLTSLTILFVELDAHPLGPRGASATSASSATSC